MITCRELAELLLDFVADQLPPERREHIEQHLALCSSCVAYLEGYRLTVQMTRRLPRPPLPPDLARQLLALLEESERQQSALDQGSPQSTKRMP
jgi:anti-sigma factor RsiW